MGAGELAEVVLPRVKREECKRTKHDSQFSKWKVLVGPSDWDDYSLGKDGATRYRVENLSSVTGSGLYELGIAVSQSGLGRDVEKLGSDGAIVVYLGQADNVRTRLQRYGRIGAHLGSNLNDCNPTKGPGLFEDVFSRGHSIVFRWVPVKNKADALKTETQLLNRFNYAWNKENNVARRHEDVLQKLSEVPSRNIQYPKFVKKLIYLSQKPVGIKIEAREKFPQGNYVKTNTDEENHSFFSQIFKFNRSQPRFILDRNEVEEEHTAICGVSLGGGSVCREPPVKGRKRCIQHRSMRINRPNLKLKTEVKSPAGTFNSRSDSSLVRKSQINKDVASESNAQISSAYKPEGAQTQVFSESSVFNSQHNTICGVNLGDGYLCTSQPAKGRVRCEKHKGLKINASIRKSALDDHSNGNSVCGAITCSGSYCSRMVKGNTRCWQHSVEVLGSKETVGVYNDRNYGGASIYGAPTRGGSYGGSSICGAPTRGGSYCRRTVKGGGRCWQH